MKLEKANLAEKGKVGRKTKENKALQQEAKRAKEVAKDALDDSIAKDREQKETERMLEIVKKDATEAHKVSNRLNAEVQRKWRELSTSRESLARAEEAKRQF